jgi:hypothetical protein
VGAWNCMAVLGTPEIRLVRGARSDLKVII